MRRELARPALLGLLLSVASYGQQANLKIEGRVLRADTGDPVAGARVTLFAYRGGAKPTYENPAAWKDVLTPEVVEPFVGNFKMVSTDADDEGKFVFPNVGPEPHLIVAGSNGYTREVYGRHVFAEAGESVVLRLTPTGALSGIVRDPSLRPAPNVKVQLLRFEYGETGQKALQTVTATSTNDLGEYRFYHIAPGRYYVRAGTPIRNADDPLHDVLALAFYPGVEAISEAQSIEIHSGEDRSAVDFRLKALETRRVQGTVVDPGGRLKSSGGYLEALYLDGSLTTGVTQRAKVAADGTFIFDALAPGTYAIKTDRPIQSRLVVTDKDIENLTITLPPFLSVAARVRVEGAPFTREQANRVSFEWFGYPNCGCELDRYWRSPVSKMDEAGRVTFQYLDGSSEYRIQAFSLPEGYYLKEATLRGVDLTKFPLPPDPATDAINIVISSNAGSVDGAVTDASLTPTVGVLAVLFPDLDRSRIDLFKTAVTDSQGKFSFRSVPPGDYRIFAWESIEPYTWFDPEVIRSVEPKGERVHVDESAEIHVSVRIIPAQ